MVTHEKKIQKFFKFIDNFNDKLEGLNKQLNELEGLDLSIENEELAGMTIGEYKKYIKEIKDKIETTKQEIVKAEKDKDGFIKKNQKRELFCISYKQFKNFIDEFGRIGKINRDLCLSFGNKNDETKYSFDIAKEELSTAIFDNNCRDAIIKKLEKEGIFRLGHLKFQVLTQKAVRNYYGLKDFIKAGGSGFIIDNDAEDKIFLNFPIEFVIAAENRLSDKESRSETLNRFIDYVLEDNQY